MPHANGDVTNVDDVVVAERARLRDALAVDGGSVGGSQILDEQILTHQRKTRMTRGNIACTNDDVCVRGTADDNRPAHDDGNAAQFLRAFLDRKVPGALFLALSAHQADSRFHNGEQEQVQQCHEQQTSNEQNDVYQWGLLV